MLLVCQVISRDKRLEYHYGWKPLMASHQFTKSGGHRHCGSGDIMISGCHVISLDQVIEGSCNFMGRSPSR